MIKHSSQIQAEELFQLGGKARGLLWLKTYQYPVPEFHLISHLAVGDWLAQAQIEFKNDFKVRKTQLIQVIHRSIEKTDHLIWDQAVAVRSSAFDEDGAEDSFAGIHESVLNVNGREAGIEAICEVVESGYSEIALAYRKSRDLQTKNHFPAVIVQKMIRPQFAGVAFTVNLQTSCRRSVWISATNGMGDQLVSGKVQGDEYVFDSGKIKKVSGTSTLIKDKILLDLARLCLEIADRIRQPQDIEWAFDGEQIWILQVRPITTKWADKNLPETVFDNSNIQESYCGVTTPLTFSYASVAYYRVYRQLMRFMLMSEGEIEKADWNLKNMLGLVHGRVYYNINNWYSGLLYLPSFGKRKQEMEDMMGLELAVDFVQSSQLTPLEKLKKLPQMAKLFAVMIYRFAHIDDLVHDFDTWFKRVYGEADIERVYLLNEFEIFEKIRVYQDLLLEKWGIPVLNDTKVMMDMGGVKQLLNKYEFAGELKSIIYGAEIESIKPTLEIHRLSKIFSSQSDLKEILFTAKSQDLLKTLEIFYQSVFKEVKSFIQNYGDRCIGELKLETITMRQDPEILFHLIRNFIKSGLDQKDSVFHLQNTDVLFAGILAKMSTWDKWRFQKKVKALKKSIAAREKMRMHRTRNFGLMRVLYLALGEKWCQRKLISETRDILYLTHDEIFNLGSGRLITTSLGELVALRKKDFSKFSEHTPDGQVRIAFPPSIYSVKKKTESLDLTHHWKGLAAAQGVCEGEIVFVRDSNQIPDLSGKILLAERTDPGWTPLFTMAKGVIVEKGSMLSHSAIIAREMGIPSVIGIPHITQKLKTGDYVRLDGDHGTIEIIQHISATRNSQEVQNQ
jgi:pyruvate,water dikinase